MPGGRQVPEAGAGPPEAMRQVLEEGGMEKAGSSSSDSSLSPSNNSAGLPNSGRASGQSNKVPVEQVAAKAPEISQGSKSHSFSATSPPQGSSSPGYSPTSPGYVPPNLQSHPSNPAYSEGAPLEEWVLEVIRKNVLVEQVAGKVPKFSQGSKSHGFLPTGPPQDSRPTRYSPPGTGYLPSLLQNHPSSPIYAPTSPTSPTYAPTSPTAPNYSPGYTLTSGDLRPPGERSHSSVSNSSHSSSSNTGGSAFNGGAGGLSNRVAVEVLLLGERLVPEAGARPPEARRQVLEEGARRGLGLAPATPSSALAPTLAARRPPR